MLERQYVEESQKRAHATRLVMEKHENEMEKMQQVIEYKLKMTKLESQTKENQALLETQQRIATEMKLEMSQKNDSLMSLIEWMVKGAVLGSPYGMGAWQLEQLEGF